MSDHVPSRWHILVTSISPDVKLKPKSHWYVATESSVVAGAVTCPLAVLGGIPQSTAGRKSLFLVKYFRAKKEKATETYSNSYVGIEV